MWTRYVDDSPTRLVCNNKCTQVFGRNVPVSWIRDIKAYITRKHDFVLLTDSLFFVDKSDGTITPGPKIPMPTKDHACRWVVDTPRGLVFLVSRQEDEPSVAYMVSEPVMASKFQEMDKLVWKSVPLTNTLTMAYLSGGSCCFVSMNEQYLLFAIKTEQPQYHVLDHSGPYVVLKSTLKPTVIQVLLTPFDRYNTILDAQYLVLGGFIFDLFQGTKCVLETFQLRGSIEYSAVSNSYICFVAIFHDSKPQNMVHIWSKEKQEVIGHVSLEAGFEASHIMIVADLVALVYGASFVEPYSYQLHALDLKTMKVKVHKKDDSNAQVFWELVGQMHRHGDSTPCCSSLIWEELHLAIP